MTSFHAVSLHLGQTSQLDAQSLGAWKGMQAFSMRETHNVKLALQLQAPT